MKKLLLVLLIMITFSCAVSKSTSESNQGITTYYLIRHAEKDKSDLSNKNPDLIEKGRKRAKKWSNHFKNINLDEIYSTNYKRTMETAIPTATNQELKIIAYNPNKIDIKAFLEKTKNQNVLIVGHSNTTPAFVNKIIGEEKYEDIDETINSKLFIVTITDSKTTSKVINID